ncbi:putative secreted protein (Por secretion system target) [Arcticibacter pallidicorallinus]|uniref:Putative secreted protein (Por secretion system target) n=2 Tax=Arcticibacter pallidicorallinus TaxID=1259464 RepID=A0A2T0TUX1_9SPHI|nr:putative secreted protein (Por secretion system target) [Arcticibacter pallidicorallinus]
MKKIYQVSILFYFMLLGANAFGSHKLYMNIVELSDSVKRAQQKASSKITDTRPNRPSKGDVKVNITPFKPLARASASSSKPSADFKVLNNVKVYPNPAEDQITISYSLTKETNVTIKIMDVLGNEIATLLSQRLPSGDQNNNFNIASRLNSGYYFIRLIAGNETIIKRISIL